MTDMTIATEQQPRPATRDAAAGDAATRDPVGRDPAGRDGAPREGAPREGGGRDAQRRGMDPLFGVRTADIEPYTGLGYLSKLFKVIAVVLMVILIIEVGVGLYQDGTSAIFNLAREASQIIVMASALWGIGDLAILLIDVGHDVRAARILIGRQTAHLAQHPHEGHIAGPPTGARPVVTTVATPAPASLEDHRVVPNS